MFDYKNEQIYVHVGLHKSASTYLQNNIFEKQKEAHYIFLSGYKRKYLNYIQSKNFDPGLFYKYIEEILQKKDTSVNSQKLIISQEELSGHPHGHSEVDPLLVVNNIKTAFPNAKIIMIIRNQLDYLSSLYSYRVAIKGQEYRSPQAFFKEEGRKGLFKKMQYSKVIFPYIEKFGKDNVLVLPFEMLKEDKNSFIKEVCSFLKIGYKKEFNYKKKTNESTRVRKIIWFWIPINYIFTKALYVLDLLNIKFLTRQFKHDILRYKYYRIKRLVTKYLNFVFKGSKEIYANKYIEQEVLDVIKYDNKILSNKLDIDLEHYGYIIEKINTYDFDRLLL